MTEGLETGTCKGTGELLAAAGFSILVIRGGTGTLRPGLLLAGGDFLIPGMMVAGVVVVVRVLSTPMVGTPTVATPVVGTFLGREMAVDPRVIGSPLGRMIGLGGIFFSRNGSTRLTRG